MGRKYAQVYDDEWIEPTNANGSDGQDDHRLTCCDCGLVHKMNFRVVKGRVQFQASRDNRATAQRRRAWKRQKRGVFAEGW